MEVATESIIKRESCEKKGDGCNAEVVDVLSNLDPMYYYNTQEDHGNGVGISAWEFGNKTAHHFYN